MSQLPHLEPLDELPPFRAELMETLGLRGIHFGSGGYVPPGWLNTDHNGFKDDHGNWIHPGRILCVNRAVYFLQHDASQPFPLEDESIDWAYSEHLIEHLTPAGAVAWLREVHRLLAPGGHLRLTTPDLRRYAEGYLDPGRAFFAEHHRRLVATWVAPVMNNRARHGDDADDLNEVPDRPAWMLNQIFRFWGHKWIYDIDEIRHVAVLAGFSPDALTECRFGEGRVADVYALDQQVRDDETLYVEISRT